MYSEIRPARMADIPALRSLWQEAFGDGPEVLDPFFRRGFAPERSRVLTREGAPVSVLYWFDGMWAGKPFAYLYAVATARSCRGRGYSSRLLEDTCAHLAERGYAAALLVPGEPGLFDFYARCGFTPCCPMETREFSPIRTGSPLCWQDYAQAREQWLTPGDAVLAGPALAYFAEMGQFFGDSAGCAAAIPAPDGSLFVTESFGDPPAPGAGSIRRPGGKNFAMLRPLASISAGSPGAFYMALG